MKKETGPKADISIRDMTFGDIPRVMELEKAVFPDPWSVAAFEQQITEEGWGGIVAESVGVIIGYGCYYMVAGEAHLTNIAVDSNYRRKSVAKQLLDNILQVVAGNKCEYIFLEVRPSNIGAITFYEKYGFEPLYNRPNYYRKPVEDALVMGRYIPPK